MSDNGAESIFFSKPKNRASVFLIQLYCSHISFLYQKAVALLLFLSMPVENEFPRELPNVLITRLHTLTAQLSADNSLEAKRECLQVCKALADQLQEPDDAAVNMAFSVPSILYCLCPIPH
jgi:hypothetical protein